MIGVISHQINTISEANDTFVMWCGSKNTFWCDFVGRVDFFESFFSHFQIKRNFPWETVYFFTNILLVNLF